MKKEKNFILVIFLGLFWGLGVQGEIAVRDLQIQQRRPWNGLVDITYRLEYIGIAQKANRVSARLSFSGYDQDLDRKIVLTTLSGDGVKQTLAPGGPYRTVWNMAADYPGFHSSAFAVRIRAEEELLPLPDVKYLVIMLEQTGMDGKFICRYTDEEPVLAQDDCRTKELWLRKIPAGSFIMGSPSGELGRWFDESQHQVTLTKDFFMGIFEVTQYQWRRIMGENPSLYTGDDRPVERVSYDKIRGTGATAGAGWPKYGHQVDADSFLGKIREKTGLLLDLPTEAQWEYACRAGTTSSLNSGKELTSTDRDCPNLGELGRYNGNRIDGHGPYEEHTRVGSYLPNQWNLYDMHGNISEWCLDWYLWGLGSSPVTDPVGNSSGSNRVTRSGSWEYQQNISRSAARSNTSPWAVEATYGLRVICISDME